MSYIIEQISSEAAADFVRKLTNHHARIFWLS